MRDIERVSSELSARDNNQQGRFTMKAIIIPAILIAAAIIAHPVIEGQYRKQDRIEARAQMLEEKGFSYKYALKMAREGR